ncbi:MAG: flagellar biosynthetic protein FliO [Gammaproteobacteria bacterium]
MSSLPSTLDVSGSLIEVTLNLGLVLAAIVLLAWIFKRVQGMDQPSAGQLRVTASLPLGPKERILVVQVGQQQILVGASSAGISTLHVLDTPIQEAELDTESFRDKLVKSLGGTPS